MILPPAPDLGLLVVRVDYADDEAWSAALAALTAPYEADDFPRMGTTDFPRMGTTLQPVESPDLDGLTVEEVIGLPREDYLSEIAIADAQTMRDQTLLLVDLNEFSEQVGRTFRVIPAEVEPIVANLSIANMDFAEFADNADQDGIFRGF